MRKTERNCEKFLDFLLGLELDNTLHTTHLNMTAWGLEKSIVRAQAVTTISLARLLCAAQLRDSSGDWMVISLDKKIFYDLIL